LKPILARPARTLPQAKPEASCAICHTDGARFFLEGADRLFGHVPGRFRLYRCSACGCIFQHPMPESSEIPAFYPVGYWWEEGRGQAAGLGGIVARLEKAYREFVAMDHVRFVERCARRGPASGRELLDVGCGGGTFLHLARRRGFVAHGLDASTQAVSVAKKQYGLDVRQGDMASNAWKGHRFDFITMFHVVEHLTDPLKAFGFAAAHLKPGGSLILQVPNVDSIQARLFGAAWHGLDVPRHIINFTADGLHHLLRSARFDGEVSSRFSLRDNPAAIASSLFPKLDPIGRKGRKLAPGAFSVAAAEMTYFALTLASVPFAMLESIIGRGGTLWVQARPSRGTIGLP